MPGQRVVNVDHKSAAGLRDVTLADVELAELDVRQWPAQNGQLTPVLKSNPIGKSLKKISTAKFLFLIRSDSTDNTRPAFSDIRPRPRAAGPGNLEPRLASQFR